ncbi:DUF7594 domain-containing protein [Reinekea marinisedimentorum]|uniref:Carbohydrate-binding module family 96 domain-containing protein n=1 Tax=Reinekea marinisedimentorum TaxID=230495 RepID=A0A4R3IBU4_9GAMM|nr:DNRLRE domain-containing protein [Reinekea marinisedimentorum]TCS43016.1 hypothetical protein BCF53_10239 [Reinekea marinisedimentorum]
MTFHLKEKLVISTVILASTVINHAYAIGLTELPVNKDSYVSSYEADNNFSDAETLLVKKSSSGSRDRKAYYSFNISELTRSLQSAYFQVGIESMFSSSISVEYTEENWGESSLDWDSQLSNLTQLAEVPAVQNNYLKVDVTSAINELIENGSDNFTLVFSAIESTSSSLKLSSEESDESAMQPILYFDSSEDSIPFDFGIDYAWTEHGEFSGHTLTDVSGKSAKKTYGGWNRLNYGGTGFYYTKQQGGIWHLVDPEGYSFLSIGLNSVKDSDALDITSALVGTGINTLGSWSDENTFEGLAYTPRWNMMAQFKNSNEETQELFEADIIPVFYPGFEDFIDEIAQQMTDYAGDPLVLGHFSDNELNFHKSQLIASLALSSDNPMYQAADEWMKSNYGTSYDSDDISDEDEEKYQGYVAETYYRIVSEAIKTYDPNHLYLGSRLHSSAKSNPYIIEAAAKYVDVISINYYGQWQPNEDHLAIWESVDKPFLITEFYTKAIDSGMENEDGAGWLVETQNDRSLFFENFAIQLLESKNCVGFHWFKFIDDDGSNKGLYNSDYEVYEELQTSFEEVTQNIYRLRSYLTSGTLDFNGLAVKP